MLSPGQTVFFTEPGSSLESSLRCGTQATSRRPVSAGRAAAQGTWGQGCRPFAEKPSLNGTCKPDELRWEEPGVKDRAHIQS